MNFSMRSYDLTRELSLAESVISTKPTIPIYGSVLVEASSGGEVVLSATDGELAVKISASATVGAAGATAIQARKLLELAKTLPDADVALSRDGAAVGMTAAGFRARLQSLPTDDFPKLAEVGSGVVNAFSAAAFRELIGRVRFSCSEDDKRFFLNGALIEIEPSSVKLVSTDSHRLSVAFVARTSAGTSATPVILPKKTLDALYRVLDGEDGDVLFSSGENHLFFMTGKRLLISRAIDGKFPAYQRIVPPSYASSVEVFRAPFLDALRRSAMVADQKSKKVTISIAAEGLTIASASAEVGDSDERIAIVYDGAPMTFSCNGAYIADFLAVVGTEKILLQFNAPNQAIGFRAVGGDVDHSYLVMPVII